MTYVRSASAQKFADNAHTKMIIYYKDGNARTQYGRNGINNGRIAADPYSIEMRRHHKDVAKRAASIKMALIYDLSRDVEVQRWSNGIWV